MSANQHEVIQSPAVASRRRPSPFAIALTGIALLAAVLRLWSIDFGLPLITHPDEPWIYVAAERMLDSRTLDPGWYRYPAFIILIQSGVLLPVRTIDSVVGFEPDTVTTLGYAGGRSAMALFGVLTVVLTGLVGRRVALHALDDGSQQGNGRKSVGFAEIAGLAAAAMLALSYLHVKDSHYIKPDVPTGFFTIATLWFSIGAWERRDLPRLRQWLLAGVSVGLAAAAKYNGGLVLIVPLIALVLVVLHSREAGVSLRAQLPRSALVAATLGVSAVAVFLLLNPFALLSPHAFWAGPEGFWVEVEHYRSGHDGAEGSDTWRWYLLELGRSGFGPTLVPLVVIGVGMALWRLTMGRSPQSEPTKSETRHNPNVLWLVLGFLPVYYAAIAPNPVRFDRQLIPILPFLAVLGGYGIAAVFSLVARIRDVRLTTHRTLIAAGMVFVMLAAPPLVRAISWDIRTGGPDTRETALAWIKTHVPAGTTIVREWHTPPVAQAGYGDVFIRKVNDYPLEWHEATGAEYLVLSSFMYGRYVDDPEQYPDDAAFYQRLLSLPHAAIFEGNNGPVIVIYRLDDAAPAFRASR